MSAAAQVDTLTWTLPHAVAGTMVLSLNAYVLLGGADFGGGVWDLLARGRRAEEQRALVSRAIGPIWEANHVWLILVVVLLFSCFPRAFAGLATSLHIPITLALVGIVLRGSAFTFRAYDSTRDSVQRRWGRIFSMSSVVTPVLLGVCLGAVSNGAVSLDQRAGGAFAERFVMPWLASPFAWCVGVLALALFAFLAAVYLTVEAPTDELRDDFRLRALASQGALLLLGALTLYFARTDAPMVHEGLTSGVVALGMRAITFVLAMVAVYALVTRRYPLARIAAAGQASFILWGWAWSQFPYMLPPTHTISSLATARPMLQLTLGTLAVGTVILLPSFLYLFWIFKRGESAFEK